MVTEAETRRHFCGCTERIGGGEIARWDQPAWNGSAWVGEPKRRELRWTLHSSVPAAFKASIAWAFAEWAKVCAIKGVYVDRLDQANIVITAANIDGPSNTLAWAQLPFGPDRQLESRIDTSEAWHLDPTTPPTRGRVHLGAVMCHELGHAIGLEHDNSPARNLLDPMYGPDVLTPQAGDIKAAVTRYGPAFDTSPTPTPTPTPGADGGTITVNGVKYDVKLARAA
jgi:hypothetical protein